MKYIIHVVSDSIGETAEHVVKAAVSQFDTINYMIKRHSYVNEIKYVDEIINYAKNEKGIIAYTLVLPEIREALKKQAEAEGIPTVDLITGIIDTFSGLFGCEPKKEPGLIRRLDVEYFKRVEAIEFAVKYDDGKDVRGIKNADVVLIGVSRTSKTPLSMYLANKNIKVANVPLVPEVQVPKELFEIDKRKIIGLMTNPIKLNEIRIERLKALGLKDDANYANFDRILMELDYAENVMKKIGCPVIDVATKAVEETAGIIIEIMGIK